MLNKTRPVASIAINSVALNPVQTTIIARYYALRVASIAENDSGSKPRPGEVSLAHHGVLFLDELAEFDRGVLEVMREPLESGRILISRASHQRRFPARFQLVAAMNPCPCGYLGDSRRNCSCTPAQIQRYQARLSGPLLDRIDLQVEVPGLPAEELTSATPGEASAGVRERVLAARARQLARGGLNAHLDTHALEAASSWKTASVSGWPACCHASISRRAPITGCCVSR